MMLIYLVEVDSCNQKFERTIFTWSANMNIFLYLSVYMCIYVVILGKLHLFFRKKSRKLLPKEPTRN